MNILTVGPTWSPHTLRPVRSLAKAGHRVCLLGRGPDPLAGEDMPGYEFVPFPEVGASIDALADKLTALKRVFRPDVTHVHWVDVMVPVCVAARLQPLVVSVWGSDINEQVAALETGMEYTPKAQPEVLDALRQTACVVVDDPAMREKCRFVTGGTVPVELIPLGVDDIFFRTVAEEEKTRLRRRLGLTRRSVFLATRSFLPFQRHERILEGFALAAKGEDAELVIKTYLATGGSQRFQAGARAEDTLHTADDAAYLRHLMKTATQRGIWNQVKFCAAQPQEDLPVLYGLASACINLPEYDGFPVTFVEAAATGMRVITCPHPAYDVPLVRNWFDVLADDSAVAVADAVRHVLDQAGTPADRKRRIGAREQAWSDYRHAGYLAGLIALYEQVAGKSKEGTA